MTAAPGTPDDWTDTNPESTAPERILPTPEDVTPSATKVAMVCYAVGAASKCWEHPERAGVFDSDRASQIVTELCVALGMEQQGDTAPESARAATLTPDNARNQKCRYMEAAYPTLDADDSCTEHRHDAPTFALARAMAEVWQQQEPTDEQVGWCLDDAAAVVEDFDAAPLSWVVTETRLTREAGLDFTFDVNGVEYVIQDNTSGGHLEVHPVSRSQWDEWQDEDDDDA